MAHFYAAIQGNRGQGTRMGTKSSGISGHIRGWNVGAKVECDYDEDTDTDKCHVYATGGSSRPMGQLIAVITWVDGQLKVDHVQSETR